MIKYFSLPLHKWCHTHYFLIAQHLLPPSFKPLFPFLFTLSLPLLPNIFLFPSSFPPILFFVKTFLARSIVASVCRSILGADFGKTAEKQGFKQHGALTLFFNTHESQRLVELRSGCLQKMLPAFCSTTGTVNPVLKTAAGTLLLSAQPSSSTWWSPVHNVQAPNQELPAS